MTDPFRTPSESPSEARSEMSPALRLTVVRYDGSPDRGTVHSPGRTGIERMERWMSLDVSMVSDLSAWR